MYINLWLIYRRCEYLRLYSVELSDVSDVWGTGEAESRGILRHHNRIYWRTWGNPQKNRSPGILCLNAYSNSALSEYKVETLPIGVTLTDSLLSSDPPNELCDVPQVLSWWLLSTAFDLCCLKYMYEKGFDHVRKRFRLPSPPRRGGCGGLKEGHFLTKLKTY